MYKRLFLKKINKKKRFHFLAAFTKNMTFFPPSHIFVFQITKKLSIPTSKLTMASELCCKKCPYKTSQPDKLYTHLKSVHGYTCSECDFTTIFKRDLQRHINSIHQEKNLTCTQCNYNAPDNEGLILHFKEKHNKINYQCLYCQYHTHWRTNLYKHVKRKHRKKEND